MKVQAGKSLIEAPAVPDQQPVDIRIFLQQAVGWGADQPGDLTIRIEPFEVMDD